MEIPMLERDEAERVFALVNTGISGDPFEREWGPVREYERVCGFCETNPMALYHHQVEKFGPPCEWCGKPLRTPDARLCGACMRPLAAPGRSTHPN
jgi:hypothetical protein